MLTSNTKSMENEGNLNNEKKRLTINVQIDIQRGITNAQVRSMLESVSCSVLAPRAVYGNAEFNKLFSTPCH